MYRRQRQQSSDQAQNFSRFPTGREERPYRCEEIPDRGVSNLEVTFAEVHNIKYHDTSDIRDLLTPQSRNFQFSIFQIFISSTPTNRPIDRQTPPGVGSGSEK
jgi:hypothetical protein